MEGGETQQSQQSTSILLRVLSDPDSGEAFRRFTGKYLPRMKECCRRLGMQDADADDVCADILLRFHERHEFKRFVFESKERFNRWLNTVVRNAVFTFVRDRGRRPDAWSVGRTDAQQSLDGVAALVAEDLLPDRQLRHGFIRPKAVVAPKVRDSTAQGAALGIVTT